MNRHKSLDILRGLSAFAIMIYHYSIWTNNGMAHPSNSFLGRIGMYGVSIFYVLSGLTMGLVYFQKMNNAFDVKAFFVKRICRIFPLYWLVCLLSIFLLKTPYNLATLWLNFSGLFAFFQSNSLVTGGWSIGNELVFYTLFPLIIWLATKRKLYLNIVFIISLMVGLWFCFYRLTPLKTLPEQWQIYTNPFNQLFFFVGGIWLSVITLKIKNQYFLFSILLILSILFIFMPTTGGQIILATNVQRIIFSMLSIGICFGAFQIFINDTHWITKGFVRLGEISYGVYLLHPICFFVTRKLMTLFFSNFTSIHQYLSITTTILISYLSYKLMEKPAINLGKKMILLLK